MIFVSVGTQLGFDRLIKIIDSWALVNTSENVFAQIGSGDYIPKNINYKRWLAPAEYQKIVETSSLLVSHAGMGSIITAIDNKKPIILLPRLLSLCEHRNDHQLATAEKFQNKKGIYVAYSENDIIKLLDEMNILLSPEDVSNVSDLLVKKLDEFIKF